MHLSCICASKFAPEGQLRLFHIGISLDQTRLDYRLCLQRTSGIFRKGLIPLCSIVSCMGAWRWVCFGFGFSFNFSFIELKRAFMTLCHTNYFSLVRIPSSVLSTTRNMPLRTPRCESWLRGSGMALVSALIFLYQTRNTNTNTNTCTPKVKER